MTITLSNSMDFITLRLPIELGSDAKTNVNLCKSKNKIVKMVYERVKGLAPIFDVRILRK